MMTTAVNVGSMTVRRVEPLTVPVVVSKLALMVEVPGVSVVASPSAAIDDTDKSDDAQVTKPVRSFVELSLKVPVAVNCCG